MKYILFFALFIASTGCVTQKRCLSRFPTQNTKDSIYIETVKEIPVILPADTVNIEVPINCPDQELVNIETSKLIQQISILKGKLISNTLIKPDTVYVHTKETKTITKEVKVPQPIEVIPKIYKHAMSIVVLIFIAGFGFIGYKLYRFFRPKLRI